MAKTKYIPVEAAERMTAHGTPIFHYPQHIEAYLQIHDEMERHEAEMSRLNGGTLLNVTDAVRMTDAFRAANAGFHAAFRKLQAFHKTHQKPVRSRMRDEAGNYSYTGKQ